MWEFVDKVVGISLREKGAQRRPETEASLRDSGLGGDRLHWMLREPDPDGGVAGCFRSHVAAAKFMHESGAKWGVVFEDDVRLFQDVDVRAAAKRMAAFCATVPHDKPCWIQLGYLTCSLPPQKPREVAPGVLRVQNSTCMHAYLINRAVMWNMSNLDWGAVREEAIDTALVMRGPHYVATPMLFYQDDNAGSHIAMDASYTTLLIQKMFGMRRLARLSELFFSGYDAIVLCIVSIAATVGVLFAISVWAAATKIGPDTTGAAAGVAAAVSGLLLVFIIASSSYALSLNPTPDTHAPFPLMFEETGA